MRHRRWIAVLTTAAVVAAGCSSGLDIEGIESDIEQLMAEDGMAVLVDCPQDIPFLLGYEAECEMVYDAGGRITPVYVTVMNLDGDLEWSITSRTPTGGDRVTGNDGQSPTFGE